MYHALSCIRVRKAEVNLRHDRLNSIIMEAARARNCAVSREPQSLSSQERADAKIIFPDGRLVLTDIHCVANTSPTWLQRSSRAQLAAADQGALNKHAKHDQMAADIGAQFVPVVCEVLGGIHDEAITLFKEIVHADHDQGQPWKAGESYQLLVQRFSVAIQVGNARIFDRVAQLNRVALLSAPSKRHRIAIPQPRPVVQPQFRIRIPDHAPPARNIGDAAELARDDTESDSISTLLSLEHSRDDAMSDPGDHGRPATPSDRDIEIMALHNAFASAHDDEASAADTELDSDTDEDFGFPGEDAWRDKRVIVLDHQRGRSRRR
jgi:hypothetical protein